MNKKFIGPQMFMLCYVMIALVTQYLRYYA